jgi:quercetin dioxygenase-like cupin family protein
MRGLLVAALLAACSKPAPTPVSPSGSQPPGPTPVAAAADAPTPSDDEKLAAIQKAMNELDEAAQGCWAVAATERFDIAGELTVMVDITAEQATSEVTNDTARNPKLAACVAQLLAHYRWAPPLYGQTIQLPFKFDAPDGQSVIDRKLVEWKGQGKLSVAVLLDESNSGNPGASMFELAIAAGGSTGWRKADRAELWYFLGNAKVNKRDVAAGDVVFVKAGEVREVSATTTDVHAVIVVVPGMREGSARAGALPTPEAPSAKSAAVIVPASAAKTFGPATIFVEPATIKAAPLSASVLALAAGANVPEHVHASETELLYVLEGSGTMTIAGQAVAVTPTSVIQIPPNTKHAFTAAANVRALQLYTPAGPEQRFKQQKPKVP